MIHVGPIHFKVVCAQCLLQGKWWMNYCFNLKAYERVTTFYSAFLNHFKPPDLYELSGLFTSSELCVLQSITEFANKCIAFPKREVENLHS